MKITSLLLIAALNAGPLHAADTALSGFMGLRRFFDDPAGSLAKIVIPKFPRTRDSRGGMPAWKTPNEGASMPHFAPEIPEIGAAGPVAVPVEARHFDAEAAAAASLHGERAAKRAPSSLQLVLDRCRSERETPGIASPAEFLAAYGGCLLKAKGLLLTQMNAHRSNPWTIQVYGVGSAERLLEMNGTVRVPGRRGSKRLMIESRRDLLPSVPDFRIR